MENKFKLIGIATVLTLISLTALLLYVGTSCGGKESWNPNYAANAQGLTYDKAMAVIDSMASVDWKSPDKYNKIKQAFIDDPKSLEETERIALRSKLNRNYADQLIRTARGILDSDCSPRHSTLFAAMNEYNSRDFGGYVPAGVQAVKDDYALHQKQLSFSISSSYSVGLKSFLDAYNSAYDTQKRSEAAAIRATNPTCTKIKNNVATSRIDQVLAGRKQNYYNALVNKFCRTADISKAEYNKLYSKLYSAKNASALQSRIDAHWEQLQSAEVAK